jgi:hypothetical protein
MKDFKQNLIKLGAVRPELRPHIRPILASVGYGPSLFQMDDGKFIRDVKKGLERIKGVTVEIDNGAHKPLQAGRTTTILKVHAAFPTPRNTIDAPTRTFLVSIAYGNSPRITVFDVFGGYRDGTSFDLKKTRWTVGKVREFVETARQEEADKLSAAILRLRRDVLKNVERFAKAHGQTSLTSDSLTIANKDFLGGTNVTINADVINGEGPWKPRDTFAIVYTVNIAYQKHARHNHQYSVRKLESFQDMGRAVEKELARDLQVIFAEPAWDVNPAHDAKLWRTYFPEQPDPYSEEALRKWDEEWG